MTAPRSLALIVVGVVLALAGLTAVYVTVELADADAFADRAVDALRSEQVRGVIAEQVAVELLERGTPDLVASRPLVLTAVEAVLETDEFARVLRRSVVTAHELLLRGDRDVDAARDDRFGAPARGPRRARRRRRPVVSAGGRLRPGHEHRRPAAVGDRLRSGPRHPESSLLVMNHWIDRFPPSFSANRAISPRGLLLERVRSCRERLGRDPNVIATDFYDHGDVVATVRELNARGPER